MRLPLAQSVPYPDSRKPYVSSDHNTWWQLLNINHNFMIKSKNPSQHTTPHTGGTTRASTAARWHRVGSHPHDNYNNQQFWFFPILFDMETTRSTHPHRPPLFFVHQRAPPCGWLPNVCKCMEHTRTCSCISIKLSNHAIAWLPSGFSSRWWFCYHLFVES